MAFLAATAYVKWLIEERNGERVRHVAMTVCPATGWNLLVADPALRCITTVRFLGLEGRTPPMIHLTLAHSVASDE
jgi:hypothetical protein